MLTVCVYCLPLREPVVRTCRINRRGSTVRFERQNCEGTFVGSAKRLPQDKLLEGSIPIASSRLATDLFVDRPRDLGRPRFSWAV
jgi:hypothetical protein